MRERRHGKKALSKKDQYQPGGLDGCAAIRIGWKLKKLMNEPNCNGHRVDMQNIHIQLNGLEFQE